MLQEVDKKFSEGTSDIVTIITTISDKNIFVIIAFYGSTVCVYQSDTLGSSRQMCKKIINQMPNAVARIFDSRFPEAKPEYWDSKSEGIYQ
jgi:hypothetical protein